MKNSILIDDRGSRFSNHIIVPLIIFLFSLIATFFLWNFSHNVEKAQKDNYFDFRVQEATKGIQDRLKTYEQVLRGVQGLFAASDFIGRGEYNAYVESLKVSENYPGIQGIGFSLIVYPWQKDRHTAQMKAGGFSEYDIWPQGIREIYTSIVYLEPFQDRNLRAFAYDMYTNAVRREAMNKARDEDEAAMSGKVRLVQENGGKEQAGFLIYLPVYRRSLSHETLQDRRKNIIGWVYSPFRMHDLMEGLFGEWATDLDVEIFDGDKISLDSLMFDSDDSRLNHFVHPISPAKSIEIQVSQRKWTIYVRALPSLYSRLGTSRSGYVVLAGIIAGLLFSILSWYMISGRIRAIRMAREMNRDLISSQEALEESNEKLQAVLDSSQVAIAWADDKGKIEYANRKFLSLFGYSLEEIPTVEDWYHKAYPDPNYRKEIVSRWDIEVHAGQRGKPMKPVEARVTSKDGNQHYVIIAGSFVGKRLLAMFSDITDRIESEEKLKESEERFRLMANTAPVMIWLSGIEKEFIWLNKEWLEFTGRNMYQELGDRWMSAIHPDDFQHFLDSYSRAFEKREPFRIEFRLRRVDGEFRWVLNSGSPRIDDKGVFSGYIGTCIDITEKIEITQAMAEREAWLRAILDNSPYLIWLKDIHGRFIAANKVFLESAGVDQIEDIIGKTDLDIWPFELAEKYREDDKKVLESRQRLTTEEKALNKGELLWMETTKTPIFDDKGQLLGTTGSAKDITARKIQEEKMEHQAYHDALTGLPNRILFADRFNHTLSQVKREKQKLALLFIDLDKFKNINDNFGHEVGDFILREAGKRLQRNLRESDTIARIGGDEFVAIISPVESQTSVEAIAEKIRSIMIMPYNYRDDQMFEIGSSIGIALYPEHGNNEHDLLIHADQAMYNAKQSGRNIVKVYDKSFQAISKL